MVLSLTFDLSSSCSSTTCLILVCVYFGFLNILKGCAGKMSGCSCCFPVSLEKSRKGSFNQSRSYSSGIVLFLVIFSHTHLILELKDVSLNGLYWGFESVLAHKFHWILFIISFIVPI